MIKKSLKTYDENIKIEKESGADWYNKACGHSLLNQIDDAINCLLISLVLDKDSKKLLKRDPDLKNLRKSKQYKKLFLK